MEIYLGHGGLPCLVLEDVYDWEDVDEPVYEPSDGSSAIPDLPFLHGKECTTVVDRSGVHSLMIGYCKCPNACTLDKQLFAMGMFPASFSRPKSAFTFSVLDGFLLDNLECGTSAINYYSKLRRKTSSIFPHLVPDWYRELMRVGRQWRQLKLLKWNGLAHEKRQPASSELALFCPACPQPRINVPQLDERDRNDPEWLYARSLVMDGNFKAEHLHPTRPEDEVWLTDGMCFMVTRDEYKAHLAGAKDHVQIQINMDYALCHALSHHTKGLTRALTFYDINCQYNKYFRHRVNESLHLSIPAGMEIILGIGLWHVHGHQDKCYVRYASTFITGAARIDGEIMKTLWAPLNVISPSARGMSTLHRQECLDYQMNDSNFMKMIKMSGFLYWKYREAVKGVSESMAAFQKLNDAADPIVVKKWEEQDQQAQMRRIADPSAMDVFDVQLQKAPTRKQQELALLSRVGRGVANAQRGAATWIASSITIEELQISLLMDIRRLGKHPTETQHLEIGRRWTKLQNQIDEFTIAAVTHLGEDFDLDDNIQDMEVDFIDHSEQEGDGDTDGELNPHEDPRCNVFCPKNVLLPLPSNISIQRCTKLGVVHLIGQEIALWEGQANDALQAIRVLLADKAVLFRTTVRPAKSQVKVTRAWMQVHSVERVIRLHAMIYAKCRAQLGHLQAHTLLKKYLRMEKCHLKATAAVADPNARGQRNSTLPWFWSLNVQGDSVSNNWMNECASPSSDHADHTMTEISL
ncbi:uncharacterized protein F5147DRAFT_748656 [Suillus discolor]|uniref:CxC2-like cysteine cluster KDZ transposase-associated domain-containing protein n=1 Tax=Suillus discolor TaxID=1912936 RepID=A0A9P7ES06_9AGAM|nr:uncharacterized protein F5147DRAFT_748656 [Suillus discolor]KAG2085886.1 hypothetical protein F5147DRAFT_748656 [Suillus discolor]